MQVKPILDNDFAKLVNLYIMMYAALPTPVHAIAATHGLTSAVLNKPNFIALGLYIDENLVGFVTGYEIAPLDFYFSGIYATNPRHVKPLMDAAEKQINELGYKNWESDATSDNVEGLLNKYGAKPIHTKYRKET